MDGDENLDIVLTRDRSSGRVHRRMRHGGRLMVDERCQTDQSGAFEVVEAEALPANAARCRFCFPPEERGGA